MLTNASLRRYACNANETSWLENCPQQPAQTEEDSTQFKYQAREQISSMDDIYGRFSIGYYHTLQPLEEDVMSLLARVRE